MLETPSVRLFEATKLSTHGPDQGNVYQRIIEEVIEGCVVTFEEDGVERKLLDELKKVGSNDNFLLHQTHTSDGRDAISWQDQQSWSKHSMKGTITIHDDCS